MRLALSVIAYGALRRKSNTDPFDNNAWKNLAPSKTPSSLSPGFRLSKGASVINYPLAHLSFLLSREIYFSNLTSPPGCAARTIGGRRERLALHCLGRILGNSCQRHRKGRPDVQISLWKGNLHSVLAELSNDGTIQCRTDVRVPFRIADPGPQAHVPGRVAESRVQHLRPRRRAPRPFHSLLLPGHLLLQGQLPLFEAETTAGKKV
jgi:hypothetical protein